MTTKRHGLLDLARHPSTLLAEIFEAGAAAGLIGGVAMALFASLYEAARGAGFWTPLEAIATTVLRASTLQVGVGPVLLGLAFHLIVSMFFGVLFSLIVSRDVAPAPALAFGTFAGLSVLVIMSLVVVPAENPAGVRLMWGSAPSAVPVSIAFVMHMIYGAGLSLTPALRRHHHVETLPVTEGR